MSDTAATGADAPDAPDRSADDERITIGALVGERTLPWWFWRAVIAVGFSVMPNRWGTLGP